MAQYKCSDRQRLISPSVGEVQSLLLTSRSMVPMSEDWPIPDRCDWGPPYMAHFHYQALVCDVWGQSLESMIEDWSGQTPIIKLICEEVIILEKRKKETKMNLLYQGFWSSSLVVFAARSLIVYSNHQTDERGVQNLIEKA